MINKGTWMWSFNKGRWHTKILKLGEVVILRLRDPSTLEVVGQNESLQFRGMWILLLTKSDLRLVLCDEHHGMSSYPRTVYPRAYKVKNVKHMLSMKVKLKKDSG